LAAPETADGFARQRIVLPFGLLLVCLTQPAHAHVGHTSYCSVQSVPGGLDMTLEVPLASIQGTPQPLHELEGHVRALTPQGECSLDARELAPGDRPDRARYSLDFSCPSGAITLGTDYGMQVESSAEVVCAIDGNAHVFRAGALDYVVGTPPGWAAQLSGFVRLGAWHVWGGLDHVLFVVSLLLGAAATLRLGRATALRRLALVITGFTLGHSVTLLLAALDILRLPTALTESLIALSIVLVALHNLLEQEPRGRVLSSAAFGLIHGFGFASSLAETGLPRRGTVASLLAFNVGIELAQLLLVVGCFPLLVWARSRPWFRARLLVPSCGFIAALAGLWFAKRALGLSVLPWLGG
jgi:hypothetical protein